MLNVTHDVCFVHSDLLCTCNRVFFYSVVFFYWSIEPMYYDA